MTPEEYAKKHCKNGHDPMQCEKLRDLRELIDNVKREERERCAKAARDWGWSDAQDDTRNAIHCADSIAEIIRNLV